MDSGSRESYARTKRIPLSTRRCRFDHLRVGSPSHACSGVLADERRCSSCAHERPAPPAHLPLPREVEPRPQFRRVALRESSRPRPELFASPDEILPQLARPLSFGLAFQRSLNPHQRGALWDSGGLCRQTGPFCDAGVVYAPAARLKGSVEPGLQEPRLPSHTPSGIGSESPTCPVSRRTPCYTLSPWATKAPGIPLFRFPTAPVGLRTPSVAPVLTGGVARRT